MLARLNATCCAVALGALTLGMLGAAGPAGAQNFGNATLKPGQTAKAPIMGLFGYVQVRLCNDFTSTGTIAATIHPRDTRTLAPGECTEDTGDEIEVTNRGPGQAMVIWQPPPGSFLKGRME